MRHQTIQSALAERREQFGFVTLQDMADFINKHRTADEPGRPRATRCTTGW